MTRLGSSPITETKAGRLQRLLYELLTGPLHAGSGALPTSVRFLFYELVQAGLVDKHAGVRRPDQDVSDALMVLRRAGRIPWAWIRDETRRLQAWALYGSIIDGVRDQLDTIRLDPWDGQPPLILTESRSLAGVLEDTAYKYGAAIAATNGQVGGFLHTDIIPALSEGQTVLYFGDLDRAGRQIEANTRREIEAEVGELAWERLALTDDQVRDYNVPAKLKKDGRDHVEEQAYETEALSQRVIIDMLVDRLEQLMPQPLDDVQVRAKVQRDTIREVLA